MGKQPTLEHNTEPTWSDGWDELYRIERDSAMSKDVEVFVGDIMEAIETAVGTPESVEMRAYSDKGDYFTEVIAESEEGELRYVEEHETALKDTYQRFYNHSAELLSEFYEVEKEQQLYNNNPMNGEH